MKVATVESSLIVRTLGALRPAGLAAVEHGLALALGLNPSASK